MEKKTKKSQTAQQQPDMKKEKGKKKLEFKQGGCISRKLLSVHSCGSPQHSCTDTILVIPASQKPQELRDTRIMIPFVQMIKPSSSRATPQSWKIPEAFEWDGAAAAPPIDEL